MEILTGNEDAEVTHNVALQLQRHFTSGRRRMSATQHLYLANEVEQSAQAAGVKSLTVSHLFAIL